MNTFISINTEYLSPSRTIEVVLVSNSKTKKMFYVYNFEGNSFSVFSNIIDLIQFFEVSSNACEHFDKDEELDSYFSKLILN
jgi:hypothetical protein